MFIDKDSSVRTLMSKKVVVANTGNKFSQVRQLFGKFHLHHLPVVEPGDRVIGIISAFDVMKAYQKFSEKGLHLDDASMDQQITIAELMTKDPDTIDPETTIFEAAKMFAKNGYHSLPVVEDGVLRGLLTSNDLIKYILND